MPCQLPFLTVACALAHTPADERKRSAPRLRAAHVAALGHAHQAGQEVVPALGVRRERRFRQPAMHEPKTRAVPVRLEIDLYRARARWHRRTALPAPGEDDAARRNDLDEPSVDDVLVVLEVDMEGPARPRLELGDLPLPSDPFMRVGQQPENGLRSRRDGDDLLNCLCVYGHGASPFALPVPLPASAGAGSRPSRTQDRHAAARCSRAAPDRGASCRYAAHSPGPPPSARAGAARSPDGSRRNGGRSRPRRAPRSRPGAGSRAGAARRWRGSRLPPAHVSTHLRKCQLTYSTTPPAARGGTVPQPKR